MPGLGSCELNNKKTMLTQNQQPTTYLKSKQGMNNKMKGKNNLKAVLMLFGFLIFVGGAVSVFLISQNQNTTPVAPNVPQSKPAAYIEKVKTCTLVFDVTEPGKLTCGTQGCAQDSQCGEGLICVGATKPKTKVGGDNCQNDADCGTGNKCYQPPMPNCPPGKMCPQVMPRPYCIYTDGYCSKPEYKDTCSNDPSTTTCCSAPEEPELLACGEKGCTNTSDCEEGFVCVSTAETDSSGNIVKYCADDRYLDTCVSDPSAKNCCEAPPAITVTTTITPTDEPTITPTGTLTITSTATPPKTLTPSVTTVITTVGCNESCDANADCANISHICYEGQCRLDVNPSDAQCKLPSGETTIVRPVVVPTETGPADWINYVKAGLGTLGIGALLLLLL